MMSFIFFEQTLSQKISCKGIGLHSGAEVQMVLHPAEAGQGIIFRRGDLGGNTDIPARYDGVARSELCSLIQNEQGDTVMTVEHLMAAFAGCGIDNALVVLDGPEVPIMDGSAAPFMALIEDSGVQKTSTVRRYLKVMRRVEVKKGESWCALEPGEKFSVSFEIDFFSIGFQSYDFLFSTENFKKNIASCRTFGFMETAEQLLKKNLVRGASLENTVLLDGGEVLNKEGLRFKDEFVRHKILDAIGDLYLAGGEFIGKFTGFKSGHSLTNLLLRRFFAEDKNYQWVEAEKVALK